MWWIPTVQVKVRLRASGLWSELGKELSVTPAVSLPSSTLTLPSSMEKCYNDFQDPTMHSNAQATTSFQSIGIINSSDFFESCTDKHLQLYIPNSLKYMAQKQFCQAFGLPLPTFQPPNIEKIT
jgi:hypothetical protein